MKTFRSIVAFFQALLPLIGFAIISTVVYFEVPAPYNIILAITIIVTGVFASRSIFNMMRRRGVIAVMAANDSTYDLDELKTTDGDGVSHLSAQELANHFSENKLSLRKSTISIFGDWEGRSLNVKHELEQIEFNSEKNILTILFSDNCLLKVRNPRLIFVTNSYLKIAKATEVLWHTKQKNQYSYLNSGGKIETKSNTEWKPHRYDIGIGMNAVYLQG